MTLHETIYTTLKANIKENIIYINKIDKQIEVAAKNGLYKIVTDEIPIIYKFIMPYYKKLGYNVECKYNSYKTNEGLQYPSEFYYYIISWDFY